MTRWCLALMLAGCIHGSGDPAWPKLHASAEGADGGESLAPRPAAHEQTSASETVADEAPIAPATSTPTTATTTTAPTAPTTAPATEEPLQTEDIVIEIEDD